MNCEKTREKFADYLVGDVDEKSLAEVQTHLAACPACRGELESLNAIWTKLGVLHQEQPSSALRQRFYAMLEAYKEGMEKERTRASFGQAVSRWVKRFMPRRPVYQFALSIILLASGLGGGYWMSSNRPAVKREIIALKQEVNDMHGLVAVTFLQKASPSDRLMGVNWSLRIAEPDEKILQTLLDTLNHDPNVNVRLAAVDALYLFYNYPQVKEGLVNSLAQQTSPLVQLALIDLLVEIRERRAVEAIEKLMQNKKLHSRVKQRAEMGLAQLS
jgi:hypothetical protein